MAIDERARLRLHRRLEEILGAHEAETLMQHLPRAGWEDLVTKDHLDLRLEAIKHELIATFRQEFVHQTRTMIFAVVGAVASVGGLVVVASRLA